MDGLALLTAGLAGRYEIDHEIGAGGMATVYLARDVRHDRRVAIKVVHPELTAVLGAERFLTEVRVTANLQHPHILPLFDSGEVGGQLYYVMPFVEGESLRRRLDRERLLPVDHAVRIAREVAGALDHAHRHGVIHRDIKPENILLHDGAAIVADFGIALAVTNAAGARLTQTGLSLGTPQYMSPEQATGERQIDGRSDTYSLACVLYEMLAGEPPFTGPNAQAIVAKVLTAAPQPLSSRRETVSPDLEAVVARGLARLPADRYESAGQFGEALSTAEAARASAGLASTQRRQDLDLARRPRPVRVRRAWWSGLTFFVAGVLAASGAALAAWSVGRSRSLPDVAIGRIIPVATSPEIEIGPAISPDGKLVAYVAETESGDRIFVKQVDGGRANPVAPGLHKSQDHPRWSPDGTRIAFAADSAIYVIPALGGSPQLVVENGRDPSWSPDGARLAYAAPVENGGVFVRSVAGGTPVRLSESGWNPSWSPDGSLIAYVRGSRVKLSNVSTTEIRIVPAAGGSPVLVSDSVHVNLSPVFNRDGRSVFFVSTIDGARDIYHIAIRADGSPRGRAVRLTTMLNPFELSLSASGARMAVDLVHNNANIATVRIGDGRVHSTSEGRVIRSDNARIENLSLSRDGKWIAYASDRTGSFNIYKMPVDGGDPVQLTAGDDNDYAAAWSDDDKHLLFHSFRGGTRQLFEMTADGVGQHQLTAGRAGWMVPRWIGDDSLIALRNGLLAATTLAARSVVPVTRAAMDSSDIGFAVSPDRRYVSVPRHGVVFLIDRQSADVRTVASRDQLKGNPLWTEWAPDGSAIYVCVVGQDGRHAFWSIPTRLGTPRLVLTEDSTHRVDREWFAVSRDALFYNQAAWSSDVAVLEIRR